MKLDELLNEIADSTPVGECVEGTLCGWPYHAHHVIGATEVQLYRGSGNLARGDAGDIMARRDDWTEEWEVAI